MFNFGAVKSGGGFQFGTTPTTTSTATAGGFQSTGGGFSFGQQTQAPTLGGFGSFGTISTIQSSAPQFNFGQAQSQPLQTTSSFSFNTPASSGFIAPNLSGGLSFGQPASTATLQFGAKSQPTTTISLLGSVNPTTTTAAGGFSLGKDQTSTGGFKLGSGFGSQATTSNITQPSFNFGLSATTSAPAPSINTATSSGFSLGITQSTSTATTSTAPSLTGLLAPISTSSIINTGFSFGSSTTSSASNSAVGFSTPAATLTFASTIANTTTPSTVASVAATSTPSTTISATTTYIQLEDMINRWSEDLQAQEKSFLEQATQVNAWDRVLYENGEKISQLSIELEKVRLDHQRLDHDLDLILGQQAELEEVLKPLEENVTQQVATFAQQQPQHVDVERENIYKLTESLDDDMKKLYNDLKDLIEHINSSGSSDEASDNLMLQISKIMNMQMDSLQWIDANTEVLKRRVDEFDQQLAEHRQPQAFYSHLDNYHQSEFFK